MAQVGGGDALAGGEQVLGQVLAELAGGLVALLGILLQRPAHDAIQRRRQITRIAIQPIEVRVAHHQQHVEIVRRREQTPPHEHLGQHDADGEQIAARVHRRPHHLLR